MGASPYEAAGGDLVVEAAHGAQLLVDQRAGCGALVGLVDLLQRGLGVLVIDALATQLLRQRPGGQPPAAVPALDPLPGVGGVVDQADLGEAVEQLAGELVGHAALGQLVGQLLARACLPGEGVEQDLAGDGLGIGLELSGRSLLPGEPGCLALLPRAGRLAATLAATLAALATTVAPAPVAGAGRTRLDRRGWGLAHPRLDSEPDVTDPVGCGTVLVAHRRVSTRMIDLAGSLDRLLDLPAPTPPSRSSRAAVRSEVIDPDGLVTQVVAGLVDGGSHAQLLEDELLDLVGEVGVVTQEVARVLLALAELVALVGVPGAGLADQARLDAHVDQATLAADALAVHDVELGLLERRGHLVLHDLDAGAVADHVGAVLERLDATHVEPDRGVELQRPATGRGLGRAEHHADLLAQLVDEDRGRAGVVERTGHLAQRLAHQSGLEADVAVAHLTLDLGTGHERGHRVDDDERQGAGAD